MPLEIASIGLIAKGSYAEADGRKFITGTWLFQPLKKVLTFMATAIPASEYTTITAKRREAPIL